MTKWFSLTTFYSNFYTMRVLLFLLALPFSVFITSASIYSTANAASPYDNVLKSIDPEYLTISNGSGSNSYNTTTFQIGQWLLSPPASVSGCSPPMGNIELAQAIADGKPYLVTQTNSFSDATSYVQISAYIGTDIPYFDWYESSPSIYTVGIVADTSDWITGLFTNTTSNTGNLSCSSYSTPRVYYTDFFSTNLFVAEIRGIDFNAPSGYEGDIPTTPSPPSSNAVPDLNVLTATGYQAVIQDLNFNTFDDVPFVCMSELIPVMYYELWRGPDPLNDVLLTSGVMSPSVPFTYGLPTGAETYRFVAWYDCGPDDTVFTEVASLQFSINQYGALVQECGTDIGGWLCDIQSGFNFGIFGVTFNSFVDFLRVLNGINPSFCNTNWTVTANFSSDILPVQYFPQELCDRANQLYLTPTSPYNTFTLWVNTFLQGSAILLFVFGLLSILGFKVRLGSPLEDEAEDTTVRSDIPTSSTISRHKTSYVKGKK